MFDFGDGTFEIETIEPYEVNEVNNNNNSKNNNNVTSGVDGIKTITKTVGWKSLKKREILRLKTSQFRGIFEKGFEFCCGKSGLCSQDLRQLDSGQVIIHKHTI